MPNLCSDYLFDYLLVTHALKCPIFKGFKNSCGFKSRCRQFLQVLNSFGNKGFGIFYILLQESSSPVEEYKKCATHRNEVYYSAICSRASRHLRTFGDKYQYSLSCQLFFAVSHFSGSASHSSLSQSMAFRMPSSEKSVSIRCFFSSGVASNP